MDRHWFPAILIGLTLALALIFAVVLAPDDSKVGKLGNVDFKPKSSVPTVTTESYQAAVTNLLEIYQEEQDAQATYDALISVRAPYDMLNVHYELVIAMGKQASGEEADAEARFAALKAQYSWLPL